MLKKRQTYFTGLLSFFLVSGVWILTSVDAQAQVSISPTTVFMSDRSPYANLTVSNGSDTPQEITIDFRFGYSVGDEEGNVTMYYDTTGHQASFTGHVNAFPRNFILEPGERQAVRLAARGYGNKDDGSYWTRMSILATPMSPPVETVVEEAVTARITFNFEQVIPAFFRRGNVNTGLEVRDIVFRQNNEQGRFVFDLKRTGNSPFSGSVLTRILDQNGNEVHEQTSNIVAYFDIRRSINVTISDLEPGDYTAEFTFRSQRRDISRSNLLQIEPIRQSKQFTIE